MERTPSRPSWSFLKKLKEIVQQGPADVRIGKRGLCEGVIKEIDRRLKEKGVVKVKILKSALKVENMDRKTMAKKVAELVGAMLIDVRGRTFVLYRHEDYVRTQVRRGESLITGGGEGERRARKWLRRSKSQQTY